MREIEFKMERQGLVNVGDKVEIIEPAVAMSGCFSSRTRIKSRDGIIQDIRENDRGFYVIVAFDE